MEMAAQLDAFDAGMELAWVPRNQNVEADDLTNARYEEFDARLRVEVDLDKLPFMVLPKLMEQAGRLDSELKLHRTSKEAKLDKLREERSLPKAKRSKKGEMRWKDPWWGLPGRNCVKLFAFSIIYLGLYMNIAGQGDINPLAKVGWQPEVWLNTLWKQPQGGF